MGNNIGGSKTATVMKITGEFFKLKTPATVSDIIKDYPGHVLLDSVDFTRFNLRATPLQPQAQLKPRRIYLLVELPKKPPFRRASSVVGKSTKDRVDVMMTRRSVSDLSIVATSALSPSTDEGESDNGVGPGRVKMRLPRVHVERIMKESEDDVEAARKIIELWVAAGGGRDGAVAAAEQGGESGGGGEGKKSSKYGVNFQGMGSPCISPHRKYKKLHN